MGRARWSPHTACDVHAVHVAPDFMDPPCGRAHPVPLQMWQAQTQSQCRYGRGEPSPGADMAGVSPEALRMWRTSQAAFDGRADGEAEETLPLSDVHLSQAIHRSTLSTHSMLAS